MEGGVVVTMEKLVDFGKDRLCSYVVGSQIIDELTDIIVEGKMNPLLCVAYNWEMSKSLKVFCECFIEVTLVLTDGVKWEKQFFVRVGFL